ncbi:hypothetical protein HanRHA438_Chr14g0650851 [Helianthus annuus]|nr:hypothetical protein HanIR_Chr14g0694931 [Helianthus annuus]KAJ0853406.1 hypothetical protein HanRHA438_Chr14g0650851 [Helianthus annuus]
MNVLSGNLLDYYIYHLVLLNTHISGISLTDNKFVLGHFRVFKERAKHSENSLIKKTSNIQKRSDYKGQLSFRIEGNNPSLYLIIFYIFTC